MTNETDDGLSTVPSLKRFGAAALGLVSGHVELFGVELQEQKIHGLRAFMWAGSVLFCGLLLLIGLSALLLLFFWDTFRTQAMIGLCIFYAVAMLLCIWRLRITLKATSVPFSATRTELARNRDRLMP